VQGMQRNHGKDGRDGKEEEAGETVVV